MNKLNWTTIRHGMGWPLNTKILHRIRYGQDLRDMRGACLTKMH